MPANYFDERIAATYREKWPELYRPEVIEPTVSFLAGLAAGGAALEFGIGTGRIAIPLSQHGIAVHGIDLSPDMIAQLRAEPGAEPVGATIGDFATTRIDGTFRLVYLIRNTIANLTTQDAQVDCFRNAAAHLEPGGFFVIELYIPELRRLPPGETVHPFTITPTHLAFEEYDVATQIAYSHHYWVEAGQLQTFSAPFRYAWPSELDLMARLAGLTLKERWADWTRAPFTSESRSHVSVWQQAGLAHTTSLRFTLVAQLSRRQMGLTGQQLRRRRGGQLPRGSWPGWLAAWRCRRTGRRAARCPPRRVGPGLPARRPRG